jgi:hypothetical protein
LKQETSTEEEECYVEQIPEETTESPLYLDTTRNQNPQKDHVINLNLAQAAVAVVKMEIHHLLLHQPLLGVTK